MVFACYAGTGKTTLAAMRPDILDLLLAPYKYKLTEPEGNTYKERETLKATEHEDFDLLYPVKYVDAVIQNIPKYRHILIPTDERVLLELNRRGIAYVIVIPDFYQHGIKEFYEERYKKRGNNERFLEIFIGQWDSRIRGLLRFNKPHFLLPKERYLSDFVKYYEEDGGVVDERIAEKDI